MVNFGKRKPCMALPGPKLGTIHVGKIFARVWRVKSKKSLIVVQISGKNLVKMVKNCELLPIFCLPLEKLLAFLSNFPIFHHPSTLTRPFSRYSFVGDKRFE